MKDKATKERQAVDLSILGVFMNKLVFRRGVLKLGVEDKVTGHGDGSVVVVAKKGGCRKLTESSSGQ